MSWLQLPFLTPCTAWEKQGKRVGNEGANLSLGRRRRGKVFRFFVLLYCQKINFPKSGLSVMVIGKWTLSLSQSMSFFILLSPCVLLRRGSDRTAWWVSGSQTM